MKAFALLKAFRGPDELVTSAELSRRAGFPEASGYRLIQTLEAVGAVVRDGRGRYRPGFLLTSLGAKSTLPDLLSEASQEAIEDIATRFGATAHVGVLEHSMVTYVAKAAAPSSVPVPTRVGAQQEAYCSALGKVLLAALSETELASFLSEGDLVPLTERTITDPEAFRAEIERVRRTGFALDAGEAHPHLACVAVPVHDSRGEALAALSLVDRFQIMDNARQQEARAALAHAAGTISRNLNNLSARPMSQRLANWASLAGPGFADAAARMGVAPGVA